MLGGILESLTMGLLPDTYNWGLRMRRECRERFPRHRVQMKPLDSDPDTHHSTCVTHVPWCMSGSLTRGDGENVPGIPGACVTHNLRIWQEAHVITVLHCFHPPGLRDIRGHLAKLRGNRPQSATERAQMGKSKGRFRYVMPCLWHKNRVLGPILTHWPSAIWIRF